MTLTRREIIAWGAMSVMAGCSRRRAPTTLRVAFSPTTLSGMYRELGAAFVAAHPNTAIELMPAVTYGAVMQRDFRLALIEDEPDVSHVGLNHIRFYAERGLALALDERLGDAGLTAHPTIGKVGGVRHALPFAVSVPVSYLNVGLLARAGIDADELVEADWPALLAAAKAVSRLGYPLSGIFFDYTPESALAWQTLILSRGGRLMSRNERDVAFTGGQGLWSAELLAALGRAGQRDMSRENARQAFAAGQLAIYQNTSANIERFTTALRGQPMRVAPLPLDPQRGRLPAAGNAALVVTREPSRQALALDYLRFSCGPVGQTIMARATGYMSLSRAAVDGPLAPVLARQPHAARLYSLIDRLDAWYAFPGPRSEQIAQAITDVMRELLLGRVAPRDALMRMAASTERLLPR